MDNQVLEIAHCLCLDRVMHDNTYTNKRNLNKKTKKKHANK